MDQRGRKSVAALSVVTPTGALEVVNRPRPPDSMPAEQCAVWHQVVGARSADWFTPDVLPLLVNYCEHVCESRKLAVLLADCGVAWLKAAGTDELAWYEKLVKLHEQQTRAVTMLARSMRLTHQSRYTPDSKAARGAKAVQRPWEK